MRALRKARAAASSGAALKLSRREMLAGGIGAGALIALPDLSLAWSAEATGADVSWVATGLAAGSALAAADDLVRDAGDTAAATDPPGNGSAPGVP